MWTHTGGVEVRVAAGRVDGVLLKVLADVLRGGLGQQPVETLPGRTDQTQLLETAWVAGVFRSLNRHQAWCISARD